MSTTDSSASYAEYVARLLWPEPWGAPHVTRRRRAPGSTDRDAYLFPTPGRARLLVPADVPGAASMLQRLGGGRRALAVTRSALERAVRSPAFAQTRWPVLRVPGAAAGADSIELHLSHRFDTDVRVGIMLGTRRVNQKPVLQAFDRHGRLLAYVKVGHNDLTTQLVRGEAVALASVRALQPRTFEVPEVLHHARWSGLEVLAISALDTDPGQPLTRQMRDAAMHEVAHLEGCTTSTLADSSFWSRLRTEAERLATTERGRRLVVAAESLEQQSGDERVQFGSWHGDWGSWNMGVGDGVLKLWDWERFDADVPLGFDGVHLAAQAVQPGRRDAEARGREFLRSLPESLAPLGVDPALHDLTLRLYLLEIALRYEDALSFGPLPSLDRRTSWVVALLEQLLESSTPSLSKGRS